MCSLTALFTQWERSPAQRSYMLPAPTSRQFSFSRWLPPPSPHVGSSLRLHFSCLGSRLSSPANKSSANLLPESFYPCSDCSGPRLLGNNGRGGAERGEGRRRRRGSWVEVLPNGHPLCRNNRLLSQSVFQRAGAFLFFFFFTLSKFPLRAKQCTIVRLERHIKGGE